MLICNRRQTEGEIQRELQRISLDRRKHLLIQTIIKEYTLLLTTTYYVEPRSEGEDRVVERHHEAPPSTEAGEVLTRVTIVVDAES